MKSARLACCLLLLPSMPASAAVILTFAGDSEGVSLAYTGQLDVSGLQFQGGLVYSDRFFDIHGDQIIEFQNAQPLPEGQHPSYLGTSFRYSADNISFILSLDVNGLPHYATAATGDTFGFYIFERSGAFTTWMNLPYGYVSGNPIQGELRFGGESFESMGLEPGEHFAMYLPGGESIEIQVVPEPSLGISLTLAGLSLSVATRRRRGAGR